MKEASRSEGPAKPNKEKNKESEFHEMKFITTPNELKERNEKIKVKLLFLNEVKEAPLAGQPKRMNE